MYVNCGHYACISDKLVSSEGQRDNYVVVKMILTLDSSELKNVFSKYSGEVRGSEFPASRTLYSRFPPSPLVVLASVYFSIAKYCPMLQNSFPFSLDSTLGIPFPTLSSPTSRTLPAPISPGFSPPCPPPQYNKTHPEAQSVDQLNCLTSSVSMTDQGFCFLENAVIILEKYFVLVYPHVYFSVCIYSL